MKSTALLIVPLAAALASCDSVTGPEPLPVDEPPRAAILALPTNAEAQTTVPVLRIEQVSSGEDQMIGWCDEAAGDARFSVPGTGTATHIGRFSVQQAHCMDLATGALTAGVATLYAANGDEIYFSYTGQAVPGVEPPTADLFYVAMGGTGRFADAAGEVEVRVMNPTPTTWTSYGSGWIRYSASDRAGR